MEITAALDAYVKRSGEALTWVMWQGFNPNKLTSIPTVIFTSLYEGRFPHGNIWSTQIGKQKYTPTSFNTDKDCLPHIHKTLILHSFPVLYGA